jgi:D-alanyl-lipoteichoic acid acyltransferase DltB (MBOAT superfamily)
MNNFNPAAAIKVFFVGFQLGLLILIIELFELQSATFLNLSLLVFFGFLIHAFLPMRFRLTFFLLLSLASIVLALGFASGAWVIGLGMVLIGICYLPIQFSARVGLILLAGGLLAALRVDWVSAPWATTVWPVLSAMFMFRMIIYLYDIKHEKGRPELTRTLCYFFMLPNVIFPLFPVVDYKKFQRNYYNEEPERIYQRGVSWIFRGIIHLLLYRIVYQHLTIDPETANSLAAVLQFSFSAFLLYLQVSGSFHMIVGILLLFGFNLPETNHLYFLASSFNDFWRRINIYWKDFMMKVFYYPVYFRVKKFGETKAIIVSTLVVFFATWFLHAYQWFWLRGAFLLEWHDALYWAILACLVIGNSLYETRYGRDRKLGAQSRSYLDHAALACSTLATFLTMGMLWGMWSSDSMSQWISIWGTTGAGWLVMLLVVPGLFVLSMLLGKLAKRRKTEVSAPPRKPAAAPAGFWKQGIIYAASMGLVYLVGNEAVYPGFPVAAAKAVEAFHDVNLNARDQAQLERGYYENLIDVNQRGNQMWGLFTDKPADWGWNHLTMEHARKTGDLRDRELLPNVEFVFKGSMLTSNRWGMRDQDYELEKPGENTFRIAVLGASYVFGPGVRNEQTFEAIFEERLNAQADGRHYEILNFSFPGRSAVNQVQALEIDVLKFKPDVVMYIEHRSADRRITRTFATLANRGADKLPFDYLRSVAERAGVNGDMPMSVRRNRLDPFSEEVLRWSYERIVATCQEHGIQPLWVYLPVTRHPLAEEDPEYKARVAMAESIGFATMSLDDAYGGHPEKEVVLAAWDDHPNVLGHQLIAERLFTVFTESSGKIVGLEKEPLVSSTH